MGILSERRAGRNHPLTTETVVGRSHRVDLHIPEDFVSSLHASLVWQGRWWELRDLGSHNGTAVAGRRVPPGTRRRLKRGDEITFGQAAATWVLSDDGGPEALARAEGHATVVGHDGLLVLPSPEHPAVSVFQTGVARWRLESGDEQRAIADLEHVEIDGTTWTLRLPSTMVATRGSRGVRNFALEQVLLTVFVERAREAPKTLISVRLGSETFSFPLGAGADVLRVLAGLRSSGAEGWIERDALLERLAITRNCLNVAVFRIRRQFADAGFADAACIVERHKGRLRFGTGRVKVTSRRLSA